VEKLTLLYLEEKDSPEVIKKIIQIIDQIEVIGKDNFQEIKKYSWKYVASKTRKIYEKILNNSL
jgi:glycosyltransferase involved in cell wall biosynthesis